MNWPWRRRPVPGPSSFSALLRQLADSRQIEDPRRAQLLREMAHEYDQERARAADAATAMIGSGIEGANADRDQLARQLAVLETALTAAIDIWQREAKTDRAAIHTEIKRLAERMSEMDMRLHEVARYFEREAGQ